MSWKVRHGTTCYSNRHRIFKKKYGTVWLFLKIMLIQMYQIFWYNFWTRRSILSYNGITFVNVYMFKIMMLSIVCRKSSLWYFYLVSAILADMSNFWIVNLSLEEPTYTTYMWDELKISSQNDYYYRLRLVKKKLMQKKSDLIKNFTHDMCLVTKDVTDVKNGRFALLNLALNTNELDNRLAD